MDLKSPQSCCSVTSYSLQSTQNEDDDEGWITPANIGAKKKAMGLEHETGREQEQVDVACMTSDFAMQNVLIQVRCDCPTVFTFTFFTTPYLFSDGTQRGIALRLSADQRDKNVDTAMLCLQGDHSWHDQKVLPKVRQPNPETSDGDLKRRWQPADTHQLKGIILKK